MPYSPLSRPRLEGQCFLHLYSCTQMHVFPTLADFWHPFSFAMSQERAYEQSQKYKEGKSILEKALLVEAAPPSPFEGSPSPTSNDTSSSISPGATRSTHGVIGSMIAGGELISSLSPTISPRTQLINVDTSTFTATSEPSNMISSSYSTSPSNRSRLAGNDPSFRSGSSISIRSVTNSELSEDSELADS